jgi:hypothetical protein
LANFIFMLTRDDVTVPDALELVELVLATDLQHVGFKDVGLAHDEMQILVDRLHDAGRTVHLEVVSISESDELRSAEIGRDLGVDYILGGTRWRSVSELLAGSGIKYFPYPGRISQHPAVLDGSVTQIVDDVQAMGSSVDGINLLAYRHVSRDGAELLNAVRLYDRRRRPRSKDRPRRLARRSNRGHPQRCGPDLRDHVARGGLTWMTTPQ